MWTSDNSEVIYYFRLSTRITLFVDGDTSTLRAYEKLTSHKPPRDNPTTCSSKPASA